MIIWRGWGILVPIIPVALWVLIPESFKAAMSDAAYSEYFKFISAFSIFLGALAIWFLGRKLNGTKGRTLVDESTGETVVLKANHSLFFINMEYWAFPVALFVFVILFT